jgi:hypothetical protein
VVKDNPKIYIYVVSNEAVHHNTVSILQVLICLIVLIENPICEKVHVERDEAHTQLIKGFKTICPFSDKAVVVPNVDEHREIG